MQGFTVTGTVEELNFEGSLWKVRRKKLFPEIMIYNISFSGVFG